MKLALSHEKHFTRNIFQKIRDPRKCCQLLCGSVSFERFYVSRLNEGRSRVYFRGGLLGSIDSDAPLKGVSIADSMRTGTREVARLNDKRPVYDACL